MDLTFTVSYLMIHFTTPWKNIIYQLTKQKMKFFNSSFIFKSIFQILLLMLCLALTGFSQRILKGGMALTKKVNNFQKKHKET